MATFLQSSFDQLMSGLVTARPLFEEHQDMYGADFKGVPCTVILVLVYVN